MKYLAKYSHLILLVIAVVGLWAYGCENRLAGRLQERLSALQAERKQTEIVYHTDTVTLRKVRYATDTLLKRDTVVHTDTVRQLIQQEREACSAVISTCEQQKRNLQAQIDVLEKQKPSWLKRRFGCAAGVGATTSGTGLGAACGVKFP